MKKAKMRTALAPSRTINNTNKGENAPKATPPSRVAKPASAPTRVFLNAPPKLKIIAMEAIRHKGAPEKKARGVPAVSIARSYNVLSSAFSRRLLKRAASEVSNDGPDLTAPYLRTGGAKGIGAA